MLERLWGNVLLIKGKMNINPEKTFSTRAPATSSGWTKSILLMLHAKEGLLDLLTIPAR